MTRYEMEFAHRARDRPCAAEAHLCDEVTPLLAEPIVCRAVRHVPWRSGAASGSRRSADLSLIAGVGVGRRSLYKAHGIDNLHDLAALDWRTAELVHAKVDMDGLRQKVGGPTGVDPAG